MLIAAKLEEAQVPSWTKMIFLVKLNWKIDISKAMITDLERDIILTLDFDLRCVSPPVFLGRFLRLLDVDMVN